jgi:lipopolysaccharide export system permease protein
VCGIALANRAPQQLELAPIATHLNTATGGALMKTLRRLIYGEVLVAVGFVTLGFLGLFFFFDFVDELQGVGANNGAYQLKHALTYVLLLVPSHLYELLPITVLIGTIFVMARLAQSSEFTILRTSGLGPFMALRNLLGLGLAFVVLTFAVGDYLSPLCDRYGQLLKSRYLGQIKVGNTGAWLRERQGDNSFAVNVTTLTPEGNPSGIRIFEFNKDGQWVALIKARDGLLTDNDTWTLQQVERNQLSRNKTGESVLERTHVDSQTWATGISSEMVSVALLKPERMGTIDLFQYIQHLSANGQTTQRFEIEFWKKVFYPLSCLVMVVLALPFAYLHFRSGNIASHVFGGVLAGISFFLLNNVFSYIGNINSWAPWFAAAAPGMLYSLASLAAFGWLVIRQ